MDGEELDLDFSSWRTFLGRMGNCMRGDCMRVLRF